MPVVRWFLTPAVSFPAVNEAGESITRTVPMLCRDRHNLAWGGVYSEAGVVLVRLVEFEGMDELDLVDTKELLTQADWDEVYSAYPDLRAKFKDQPE